MELRNQRRQIEEEIADKTKRAQEVAAMLRLMPESREAMKRYLEARENLTQGIGTSQDVWQARENLYDAFHRVLGDGEDVWDPDDFTPLDPDP
jgi:hypothetical protein